MVSGKQVRLHRSRGSYMQREDTKGQSSVSVKTGQFCVRQQEGLFLSKLIAIGGLQKTLDRYLLKMVI